LIDKTVVRLLVGLFLQGLVNEGAVGRSTILFGSEGSAVHSVLWAGCCRWSNWYSITFQHKSRRTQVTISLIRHLPSPATGTRRPLDRPASFNYFDNQLIETRRRSQSAYIRQVNFLQLLYSFKAFRL